MNEEIFIENMGKVIKYNDEHKAKSFKWTYKKVIIGLILTLSGFQIRITIQKFM
ncbi:MAG: hypothetical protein ACP5QK_00375 [Myxococcota bacterium]